MKLTIGQLRNLIRETLAGSHPEEDYEIELLKDPNFVKKSVYVPDDVKKKMLKWAKDMKLVSQ